MKSSRRHDESGATLVIALVFVVATGLIVGTLVSLSTTNLVTTSALQNEKALEYAADGAVDTSIQALRYSSWAAGSCPSLSFPSIAPSDNVPDITVTCSGNGSQSTFQTVVSFIACPTASLSSGNCPSSLLKATVVIYNVENDPSCANPNGTDSQGHPCYRPTAGGGLPSTLGSALSVQSWVVDTANS